jgi:hypothetical protein
MNRQHRLELGKRKEPAFFTGKPFISNRGGKGQQPTYSIRNGETSLLEDYLVDFPNLV